MEKTLVFVRKKVGFLKSGNKFKKFLNLSIKDEVFLSRIKEEEFDVEVYQRLVIAFRLKDHENLPKEQSSSYVYLKSFKSIPHSDLHTLLPGTQVKMSLLDRGKIIIPALSGIVLSIVKIVRLMVAVTIFATLATFIQFWVIPAGIIYYVIKGFLSYQKTKDKYRTAVFFLGF